MKFKRGEVLPLSITTTDENGLPYVPVRPPSVTIIYDDAFRGEQEVEVVLEKESTSPNEYKGSFKLPTTILFGEYAAMYRYTLADETVKEIPFPFELNQEEFNQEDKAFHLAEVLDEVMAYEYIPPASLQEDVSISVQGNELRIQLKEGALKNYAYTLVMDGVKLKDGRTLTRQKTTVFNSEFGPMFASLEDIKQELKEIYPLFMTKAVYRAIRNAGEKALQMHRLIADVNNSRYRPMKDNDTKLFPTKKYVLYEASYTLINDLYYKLLHDSASYLQDEEQDPDELIEKSALFNGFTLGDFSVKGIGGEAEEGEGLKDTVDALMKKIRPILAYLAEQRKFWQDAMKNRNARGYTTPRNSEIKRDVTIKSRDI